MEVQKKKEGYGHLIKWVIGLGDLIVINLSFIVLYKYILYSAYIQEIEYRDLQVVFLLVNLIYFIASSLIPSRLSANIIFFDKVIKRAVSFISLYYILLSLSLSVFHVVNFDFLDWAIFYLGLVFLYTFWHVVLRSIIKAYRGKGYNFKRVVIIGDKKENIETLYNEIKAGNYGYKVLGFFTNTQLSSYEGLSFLGDLSQVKNFCEANEVDEVYCTLQNSKEKEIVSLVNFAETNMIRFFLVPDFYSYLPRKLVLNFLQSTPVLTIRQEPLQLLYNRIIKRGFDIIFSFIILVSLFPFIFFIFGLLIKLTSKGPVFFKQKRTGLKGKSFTCYKFRSMRLNEDSDEEITSHGDPRITTIGKFMRRTSLDEMPQFFNVLIGNMSVVGPRPHMIKQTDLYEKLIDRFMIRHLIKPGITGWAQISGYRGETKNLEQMEGRFRRDVWYIENWSFILDIKIIIVTIIKVIKGDEQAY
ncbi:MAG: undecaprenyl-phosphate glucose phosphotransferase [Dysgonomonas sp.]|nr:undecaprenyl-phosphate glucose phosphotransferase [Dysgonomonas sp.]